jgi:nucleotide-binding universal stress UspA family protein
MLASIMLPLAEGRQAACARDFAFWLAKKYHAHIHALEVVDIKNFEIPVLGTADGFMPSVVSPPIAESRMLLEELSGLARERLNQFSRACGEQGISCSAEVRTGIPAEAIAREAVAHDIVILSRAGYAPGAREIEKGIDPLVSGVVRGCIRPVLVAGREFPKEGAIRNMLLAFDGSVHAARALSVVVELGAGANIQCTICTVADTEVAGQETLAAAEAFLARHGVSAQKKVIVGAKAAEQLCGIVSGAGADILVMGAYGHSPIREMLFGSTTERILSHCDAAVILQS